MIAEVGDIEKVSGSRMATPLAPPRPGSTPMMTPSTMPTTITIDVERLQNDGEAVKQIGEFFHMPALATPHSSGSFVPDQKPRYSSIGPFGSGTRNHLSKMRNVTSGTPSEIAATRLQP